MSDLFYNSYRIADYDGVTGNNLSVLNILNYDQYSTPPEVILYNQNVDDLERLYGYCFDADITVFTSDNIDNSTLLAMGFNNVVHLSTGGYIELSNGYRFVRGPFNGQGDFLKLVNGNTELTICVYAPAGSSFTLPVINNEIFAPGYIIGNINSERNTFLIRWNYAMDITRSQYEAAFENAEPPEDSEHESDPFGPGGETGGGDYRGGWDYSGDPPGGADDDPFPTIDGTEAGFITIYNPTTAELRQLSSYLWSNDFDIDTFKKIFNNPIDLILGLSIVPVTVPSGGTKEVGFGYIGTGIYMTLAETRWVKVQCGTVTLPRYTGSYLDFDPYVSVDIYLPFIGVRHLKADEVMGKTIKCTYKVDILSGACVAWLDIDGHVMYMYQGQCSSSVPITAGDNSNLIQGMINIVGGAVSGAIKGGVGGAIAGGVAAASAVAVTDGKIQVDRAGNITSTGGFLSEKGPFITINAPKVATPKNQNMFTGYPLYATRKIGNLSGYTEIDKINLIGVLGTEDEKAEIISLLKGGVYL